ncbi:MAG: ATP-dependent DNA ligase [Alphaproteobacteria bacterium]|nr:ATP-dependent DNA ligase [Alphaproteobacteria bacterium]
MKAPLCAAIATIKRPDFGLSLDTPPMDARAADTLPADGGWQYEPKWDGFRCIAFKAGAEVELRAKSGKPLGRYFPEIVAVLTAVEAARFVVDGELVIELDGRLSFDALQARLHPAASRIRKLAAETPARLVLFDILVGPDGRNLLDSPLVERHAALESFVRRYGIPEKLTLSPMSRDRSAAERWLREAGHGALDGVVAKRLDGPYEPGERAMIKVKPHRTADCVVGGFRYQSGAALVGSLLLGLYDADGRLHHVGFTATIANRERPALTHRLEALIAPPGFTGNAPGGPSRWSTERSGEWQPLRPELVVEVEYDQITGGRFRHGTRLVRWRPDKAPQQCTTDQIAAPD